MPWRLRHGGDGGDRTHDLLNAIQALSQLSYNPDKKNLPKKIFLVKQIFTNICFFMNGKVFHVQLLAESAVEDNDTVSGGQGLK